MRAVVQRVSEARVIVESAVVGEINRGLAVFLGIGTQDTEEDARYLADKIVNLRVFEDEKGKMNISLIDSGGEMLVVSQFTLFGDCRKGRRPSFDAAARPEVAQKLYDKFIEICRGYGIRVGTGKFRAAMNVDIHNDGPVTLLLDSRKEF